MSFHILTCALFLFFIFGESSVHVTSVSLETTGVTVTMNTVRTGTTDR